MSPRTQKADYSSEPTLASAVWKDLLGGDKNALAHIYTGNFRRLYNYGIRISRDAVVVEDAIQDLFFELWNRREGLNPEVKSIKQYLYICLRRKILLKLQKQHVDVSIDGLTDFHLALSHKSHYLNQQINTELRQKLIAMIETLSAKQKEAIFLIYFDELSYPQVAVIMGLKIKTIYNLVHQAVSKLKDNKDALWQMLILFF
jgi:RNA polymerase sigma-70 factor (ECF subfamily)